MFKQYFNKNLQNKRRKLKHMTIKEIEKRITKSFRNNNRFGGLIYESDYYTNYSRSEGDFARRIEKDLRFDEECKKNILGRKLRNENKGEEKVC